MIVGDGRPLRFLAFVGGGWVTVRILFLWQVTGSLPAAVRGVIPHAEGAIARAVPTLPEVAGRALVARRQIGPNLHASWHAPAESQAAVMSGTPTDPMRIQLALLAMTRVAGSASDEAPTAIEAMQTWRGATPAPLLRAAPLSRLSVSSWMIARGGIGLGASTLSPQLGGTQGGVRVDYALTRAIAATARIAAPAAGAGREISLGVAWRPAGVPLRLVAEQRVALDGGRGGPALGLSGGVSALRLPAGFRLEGYAQAGAIVRDGVEKYLDASVRTALPIADLGGITLDLGGGAWGGAQRGVARVDIGPSIGARVPLAGQNVRVALDWRQRVVGNARPGSGPALTLGTDF